MNVFSTKELKNKSLEELLLILDALPSLTIADGFDEYDRVMLLRDRVHAVILQKPNGFIQFQQYMSQKHSQSS